MRSPAAHLADHSQVKTAHMLPQQAAWLIGSLKQRIVPKASNAVFQKAFN
jgi:hypothetical protein